MYTLSTSVEVPRADEKTTVMALANLGFVGNAPYNPLVAVSVKTLELYRVLRRRKVSFSVEGFGQVICDRYAVGYSLVSSPAKYLLNLRKRSPIAADTDVCSETCSPLP